MRHEVFGAPRGAFQTFEGSVGGGRIPLGFRPGQTFDLSSFDGGIYTMNRNLLLLLDSKFIHSDDDTFLRLDRLLVLVCGLVDLALDEATLNRRQHASRRL